jgi:hypothetical protein
MSFACLHRLRALAVILAVLIPLKTLAAVVLPITGVPGHHHGQSHDAPDEIHDNGAAAEHHHDGDATGQAQHCAAHAVTVPGGDETVHEHSCPHLGMASIAMATPWQGAAMTAPRAAPSVEQPAASVVLDVPLPPPTA